MSPLYLDFHRVHKPTPWIGLLLVVASVVALLWISTQQDIVSQYRDQVEAQESTLKWKKQQIASQAKAEQKETPVNEKVAAIRRAQQVSAMASLRTVESSWSRNIALLRMDVSPADHSIKLDLEARSAADLLGWIDQISHQPGVDRVVLAHQQVKAGDPFKPTQATVEIQLQPAASEQKAGTP